LTPHREFALVLPDVPKGITEGNPISPVLTFPTSLSTS